VLCQSAFRLGLRHQFELGVRAQGMAGRSLRSPTMVRRSTSIRRASLSKGTQLEMDMLAGVGLFRFTPSSPPPGTFVPPNGYKRIGQAALHSSGQPVI